MTQSPFSTPKLFALLAGAAMTVSAAHAQTTNIGLSANGGTGILGTVATASDTTTGAVFNNGSAGPISNINDGILTDRADNYAGPGANAESFAGITFSKPVNLLLGSNVTVYLNIYSDGGWFGVPGQNAGGAGSNTGGTLVASSLVDPRIQYTTNGTTWTALSGVTDNYVSKYTGASAGASTSQNIPATFTLPAELDNIEGIRLIGTSGGTAGNGGDGFLGVQEFQVNAEVPEPSTYVQGLLVAGTALVVGWRRRFVRRSAGPLI